MEIITVQYGTKFPEKTKSERGGVLRQSDSQKLQTIKKQTIMKTYNYKGFKFYKGKNSYFVGNKEDGQIAPNDNVAPQTVKECKAVINSWLKAPKRKRN